MDSAARNGDQDPERQDIERAASRWLILMEDDANSVSLQEAFETWVAADPRHVEVWRETLDVARVIARASGSSSVPKSVGTSAWRAAIVDRASWRSWSVKAAGIAALAIFCVEAPEIVLQLRTDQATSTGEIRTVHLADGSAVTLAPLSAISVSIRGTRRDVRLLRGEAYFDVVHDVARPFQVSAGESSTRVLGTVFDVKLTGARADVAVSRGAVEVLLPHLAQPFQAQLPRGQALSLTWQGNAHRESIQPDRVAPWRNGRAIFDDRPVGEVIAALRPWYRGYLITRGVGLETRRVTGVYDLRDTDRALDALAKAQHIEVSRLSPWLRVITVR